MQRSRARTGSRASLWVVVAAMVTLTLGTPVASTMLVAAEERTPASSRSDLLGRINDADGAIADGPAAERAADLAMAIDGMAGAGLSANVAVCSVEGAKVDVVVTGSTGNQDGWKLHVANESDLSSRELLPVPGC